MCGRLRVQVRVRARVCAYTRDPARTSARACAPIVVVGCASAAHAAEARCVCAKPVSAASARSIGTQRRQHRHREQQDRPREPPAAGVLSLASVFDVPIHPYDGTSARARSLAKRRTSSPPTGIIGLTISEGIKTKHSLHRPTTLMTAAVASLRRRWLTTYFSGRDEKTTTSLPGSFLSRH